MRLLATGYMRQTTSATNGQNIDAEHLKYLTVPCVFPVYGLTVTEALAFK